jgi:hypothetical protein
VMAGGLTVTAEQAMIKRTKEWLREQAAIYPELAEYEKHWGEWQPWP